jgi:crotonobetainyl-CoA:carnitine CoA-transferase CaiB-like acyl-CoA transferase
MSPRPLDGIVVLDFTQFVAGPVCTRAMAELGAEVIKIELAPSGDQARGLPLRKNGRSAYFIQQNLGKKSVCVDLRKAEGLDLVRRLVPKADVLVENFSPGAIARLGLGWEAVRKLNPDLIMASISAFGQQGPLAELPGFDFVGQAYSGITSMIGEPGAPPPLTGAAIGDVGAGVSALAAINAALYGRLKRGGGGERIDAAILDFYFHGHGLAVEVYSATGGKTELTRSGRYHLTLAPAGVFKSREGHVVIVPVGEEMWRRLARTIGQPELIDDERFRDNEARAARRGELDRIVEEWLAAQPSDEAAIAKLQAGRVPCAPVLTVADAMRHPHLLDRLNVLDVEDPAIGAFQVPGSQFRFPERGDLTHRRAPRLGEHNADVLGRHLGLATSEVGRLEAAGALSSAEY